jgi:pyruvate ferredoxin oxidoreductase beta subunit
MAFNLKQEVAKPERFAGGHRMCAGCGSPIAVRGVLRALNQEDKAVIGIATGCLEVSSFIYPYTAWQDSCIHTAFENAGATISGVEACYKALKKRGKISGNYKFIAFGGDGGTYDIGLQSLSGAMERNHDIVYVCYDNEAYMNTGIQRSSSTPRFADATTSPVGKTIPGKLQNKKDLTEILAAHNIPYVAQTTFIGNMKDLHEKAHKAIYTPGATFLNIMAPCPRGWRYQTEDLMNICKLAVETCVWPLYEIEEGTWKLNYEPKHKLPVEEYLRPQGRFAHLFKKGNEWMLNEWQKAVDHKWEKLLKRCASNQKS